MKKSLKFVRRPSHEVSFGGVTIGGTRPIAVQSMTNTPTADVEKSVVYSQMSGLSYTETAEKLGLTPKAVDNALQRARKKLKNVFA